MVEVFRLKNSFLKILLTFSLSLYACMAKDALKIASWNVENLFDMVKDGSEYEEYIPGRHNWNGAMLEKKLANISQVICDLDADVIGLQEIENDNVLHRLQSFLERVGCAYPYRAVTSARDTPVHVAVLSRVPIASKKELPVRYSGGYRSILEITLKADPGLKIFVNHWRSKAAPESERVIYAKALASRIERLPVGSEYILIGDFNSDYDEYRTMESRHNDTDGLAGINQILGTSLGDGELLRARDMKNPCPQSLCHYNLWLEIEPFRRWSHNFFGDKEAIDAILLPPSLFDGAGWEYKVGSFGVFAPRYLFGRHGEIRRWRLDHGKHKGRGFSDHLPVYATFTKKDGNLLSGILSYFKSDKNDTVDNEAKAHHSKSVAVRDIFKIPKTKYPFLLEGATVLFKRGKSAIVVQKGSRDAILLYGCAASLREGGIYDLRIEKTRRYKGMPEVSDLEIVRRKGSTDISSYIEVFDEKRMASGAYGVSEVVSEIKGIYRKGKVHIGNNSFRLFFKKKRWIPADGSYIIVHRAQIGYYKNHKELVVWSDRDFEIRE